MDYIQTTTIRTKVQLPEMTEEALRICALQREEMWAELINDAAESMIINPEMGADTGYIVVQIEPAICPLEKKGNRI